MADEGKKPEQPANDLVWYALADLEKMGDCGGGEMLYRVTCRRGGGGELYTRGRNRDAISNWLIDPKRNRGALRVSGQEVHWPFRVERVCGREVDENGRPMPFNESACNHCAGRSKPEPLLDCELVGVGGGQNP